MLTGTALSLGGCNEEKKNTSSSAASQTSAEKPVASADSASDSLTGVQKVAKGAILQAFSWDFNTIKESMPDIAAAGFTAVQTSPVNNCLEGEDGGMELYGDGKWYYHYQPTDFKIGNYQLGTRDEFKSMCDTAHEYGVRVIVDVIANHTTPQLNQVSQDLIQAGGGSLETLFHENNKKDITDYSDRLQCTTAKMGGLPDINTERPSFQEYFFNFINDCIDCGADGFRYDTAKHIGLPDDPKEDDGFTNNFWDKVKTDTKDYADKFIYGEVLQGGNDKIEEYIQAIGRTTASVYGSKVRAALENHMLSASSMSEYWIDDPDVNLVTWVESHDNYINDQTWRTLSDEQVLLGWSIIAARKGGTPLFFDRPYNSDPETNEWGMNRIGTQGSDMYKDARVSAVNFFRTAMAGEDETLINPDSDFTALQIERGKKGLVIVNSDGELNTGFAVALADGSYTDRVDGKTVYTVRDGKLTSDKPIPENSVVVLYNEGYRERMPMANAGVAADTVFKTEGDSLTATLTLENAETGTYSVDGGEAVSFKNGDKLEVKRPAGGTVVKVELRAENKDKVVSYERLEFTFAKVFEVKKGAVVYFEKPAEWADTVNVYIYNSDDDENEAWPGEAMKKESDGKYSYNFTADWKCPLLIFNDGNAAQSVQYPESKGLEGEAGKTYAVPKEG